ncbi:hypothetical protein ACFFUT_04750 [Pseudohalocynthiibacter aestuariivivens]|uniref:DUF1127 domain-containing protein n=1 Tax=Pseudohalocynthiibacter aestuariivivens TaxID=1591409 RepID=A0ABV5JD97_9RHOB|nr:hypothetical protein [Pseudohalocynthiibacter aestuariivivens]MBS9718891.1 hypothetical protein [Pseudohalocynthiibacter aestuariivivens]
MTQTQFDQPSRVYLRILFVRLIGSCRASVAEMHTRRNINKSLGKLSSRHLRDVGLIPGDIDAANSASLSQEAVTDLGTRVQIRSGNW